MSQFAKRFTGSSGIVTLMEDLGNALNQNPELIFMGGGNPAQLPGVETIFANHLQRIAQSPEQLHKLVGEYQPPRGDPAFLTALAAFLNEHFNWPVTEKNIAIANGGQSGFFTLFNMLASKDAQGNNKTVILPIVPDYLGYADTGLDAAMFVGMRPDIDLLDGPFFKYTINFEDLVLDGNTAAVCLSRPANPSGNIVTDTEISRLKQLCREQQVPLIIDAAYGKPFPDVSFKEHQLLWDEDTIVILSLSKLGLPGVRTGIVIAHEDTVRRFSRATASLSLAPSNLGPALMRSLIVSGDIFTIINEHVKPYYRQKLQQTLDYLMMATNRLPVKIHQPEGGFFLWLWFQDLPVTSQQLYERLKAKGVLVLSGHHFFQTINDKSWPHSQQCIRLSYCQPWERVQRGIDLLVEEVAELYELAPV